jgi:hypothetical protein
MRVGKFQVLEHGPKRDIELRITKEEVFSASAEPPGSIKSRDVSSYEVVEESQDGQVYYHLHVVSVDGSRVHFYAADKKFDVALLLDEFEAALGSIPRKWRRAEQGG